MFLENVAEIFANKSRDDYGNAYVAGITGVTPGSKQVPRLSLRHALEPVKAGLSRNSLKLAVEPLKGEPATESLPPVEPETRKVSKACGKDRNLPPICRT